jgi:hypothetical protein
MQRFRASPTLNAHDRRPHCRECDVVLIIWRAVPQCQQSRNMIFINQLSSVGGTLLEAA